MEIILLERVEKLGQMGDVVSVKPGFARNYLLPQRKAMRASKENLAFFEAQKAQLEADNLKRKDEAADVSEKMEGLSVVLVRAASDVGQLYGSVNARDLAAAVTEAGFTIGRNQVRLAAPIKNLGLHDIIVALHPEVLVTVTANVARSEEDAIEQANIAAGIMPASEEEEEAEAVFGDEGDDEESTDAVEGGEGEEEVVS